MKKITIAIDGFSSCGKSTLARQLAAHLEYAYIDSGAMYRSVTLYLLQNQIDHTDLEAVKQAIEKIDISFQIIDQRNCTFLNGINVEEDIRKMEISELVSPVSTISIVRRAMVKQQQRMGKEKGIVMDGRDIGTVVFPDAELKIFLTANTAVRTQRRFLELQNKGQGITLKRVKENLEERDYIDSNRDDSPLRQAKDAVIIDNTNLSPKEQLSMALALTKVRIAAND